MRLGSLFRQLPRLRDLAASVSIVVLATAIGTASNAAGFDTKDPAYVARAAEMVAQGKISKQCLPSSATAPDQAYVPIAEPPQDLIDAAAKEGELVLNSGVSDEPSVNAYKAAFQARYPNIKMTVAFGGGASAEERILADFAAGNNSIDGVISIRPTWVAKALKEKALVSLDQTIPGFFETWPGGAWRWHSEFGSTAPAFYRAIGIGYNSELVKQGLVPKSYQDLARPEFKGQLLGLDPEAAVLYASVWKHILDSVGEDTMRALGNNLIKTPLYSDIQPAAQALGAGSGMVIMQMGGNTAATMRANGAPVQVIISDTATGTQYSYLATANASHPNAAKLFANWLYSAEGQWVMSCAALAGTIAYPANGAKNFLPMKPVSKEEIARIKKLLAI
ncbi:ABC transporter substrate-binding protein [Aminobacter sp. AP02]|uniref:ABC transporter substrate-binding protein n=1 Tax=Aminobacter sp. AP02 TaxID=2135737 RepID=UPI000D6C031D|nr:ABC transporter substrate-binding protein [Aminobacter sp. AP02]PWK60335.1 ABC-type Fe3+ transport system substrate-binding protein [Aminobacter sp. AP02]